MRLGCGWLGRSNGLAGRAFRRRQPRRLCQPAPLLDMHARSARLRPWTDHSHALPPPPPPPADFNLALDLGFLTKNRTYTFFKPKFIIYATYLSEKIGYWRYISMYRHLQRNPDNQLYPMFEYLENWCQDENRHGDFLTAVLKARPELLKGLEAR